VPLLLVPLLLLLLRLLLLLLLLLMLLLQLRLRLWLRLGLLQLPSCRHLQRHNPAGVGAWQRALPAATPMQAAAASWRSFPRLLRCPSSAGSPHNRRTWKVVCSDVDDGMSQLMSRWPSAPLSLGEQAALDWVPSAGVPG
jgi:hypothetical protein